MLYTMVCVFFLSMERDVEDAVPYGCGKRELTKPPPTSLCSATSPINGGGKGNDPCDVLCDIGIWKQPRRTAGLWLCGKIKTQDA